MKTFSAFTFLALMAGMAGECQIAAWDFYGESFPVTCAAALFHPNLDSANGAGNITRGPGAPASGGVHSFRTTGFQNNGISSTAADYFQVTLRAAPGYKVSLASLDAKFNGTTTYFASPGVTSQFAYSLNGSGFTLIGNPVQSTSLTMQQVNLGGIADLQNIYEGTVITLRYYASGQTSTGGWGFYSGAPGMYGFAVGGVVSEALVSPPSVQSSGITFNDIQLTQMGVSWTPGNGERRIVMVNTVNDFSDPPDGWDPPASTSYTGSGVQVVYNGHGSSIPAVTGLTPGATYWFRIFEYNGAGTLTMYCLQPALGNPNSQAASATMLPPFISTAFVSGITFGSAILGGHVTGDGGSPLTGRGTLWDTASPVTISDNLLAEGGTDTGYFSHIRTMLPAASKIYYAAWTSNAIGTSLSAEEMFFTLAEEPLAHVTGFESNAATITSVTLLWEPLASGADGYLIVRKEGSSNLSGIPADAVQYLPGAALGDGYVAAVMLQGNAATCNIGGLSPGTTYTFAIFPFAWNGSDSGTTNYFTGSPVPGTLVTTAIPAVATYHWTGASGIDWTVAENWSPVRAVPALNDILVFDIGGSWTIVNVPVQTIGQLQVSAGTTITLQGPGYITVAGDTGADLVVSAASGLNASGAGAVTISLEPDATGVVDGSMVFSGGGHRLLAASAQSLIFNPGSLFRAGSGFSGNPFGTANLNSVVFGTGSQYLSQAGGNPFGAAAPSSVVMFQPGSLFRIDAYVVPSFGGRTYGNFEMNYPGSITATGSLAVTIGNFTASKGTFYFNVTGSPGHAISGNISIANVATLIFAPSSAGTVRLNGTSLQTISGFGSLMAGPNSTISVENSAGVLLNMNAGLNHLRIAGNGKFAIAPSAALTVSGNLVNEGPQSGLILEPDGSLIHGSAGVAGVVKRSIAAADWSDWQDGWHFLSSPVEGQAFDTAGGFITSGTGHDFDLFAWSEPGNEWVNYKNTSVPPFFTTVNGGNAFVPGKGYLCAYQQSDDKVFSGLLNVSDVTMDGLTLTGSENPHRGWNLIGNPFPCALSWYNGWNSLNISGVAQIWNEAARSYTPRNPGEVIPACNGFMVQVLGGQGSTGALVIPSGNRIHDPQPWFKEADYPVIRLFARSAGNPSCQECQVRFNPLSTEDFDPVYDGRFLPGHAPMFCAAWKGEHLSVLSIPVAGEGLEIPFSFVKNEETAFIIEAQFNGGLAVICLLLDRKTGEEYDLSSNTGYYFYSEAGDDPGRFVMRIRKKGGGEPPGGKSAVYVTGKSLMVNHDSTALLEVFSLTGRSLLTRELNMPGCDRIPLSLPAGCYLVRLTTAGTASATKVVIF